MQRIGDIELDQDLDFERRQWTIQRIGWIVFILIIVAAMLGVFGTGPLSSATAGGGDDPLSVDYQRFVRHQGEAELTVAVAGDEAREGQIEIWIATEYLGGMEIQGITPQPEEVRTAGDRVIFVFSVDDPAAPHRVSIAYTPKEFGRVRAEIGTGDGDGLSFTQWSYP